MLVVFCVLSFVACEVLRPIGELPSSIKELPGSMIPDPDHDPPDRENGLLGILGQTSSITG